MVALLLTCSSFAWGQEENDELWAGEEDHFGGGSGEEDLGGPYGGYEDYGGDFLDGMEEEANPGDHIRGFLELDDVTFDKLVPSVPLVSSEAIDYGFENSNLIKTWEKGVESNQIT